MPLELLCAAPHEDGCARWRRGTTRFMLFGRAQQFEQCKTMRYRRCDISSWMFELFVEVFGCRNYFCIERLAIVSFVLPQ